MTHPHHGDAKRLRTAKVRNLVGSAGTYEYPADRANRIAAAPDPLQGNPDILLREQQKLSRDPETAVRQLNSPKQDGDY